MAIITVSRQLGSLGTEVAKKLGEELEFNYFDKGALEGELFNTCGISEKKAEKYDEKKPTFWETLSADKDKYRHCIKTMIYKFARKGHCIIIGRGGQILFRDIRGVLHVRVIAPMKLRIERIKARFSYDDQLAEQAIRHSDQDRAGFHKYFFQINWEDPHLYHLTLSTDVFTVETGARVIKDVVESIGIMNAHPEKDSKLADLCLSQEIITKIKYQEEIPVQFLEVVSASGAIILRGTAITKENIKRCEAIAHDISGVERVINEIRYIHNPYSMR
jgi:cytidylate kinase